MTMPRQRSEGATGSGAGSYRLREYRRIRDPQRTPEPVPGPETESGEDNACDGDGGTFVVQEHHASSLHWDVRLERNGVLASWALPKGLPAKPGMARLAVPTEDHPLDYASFEGEIPEGEYGAGHVRIWDRGHYTTRQWNEREVSVVLHGRKVRGPYVFFRKDENWLVRKSSRPDGRKSRDGRADGQDDLPDSVRPMLAVSGSLPDTDEDPDWAYEFKWDGVRALARMDRGALHLQDRNGGDITATYPELGRVNAAMQQHRAWLDGEIVAWRSGGPSFSALQRRMHAGRRKAQRLSREDPVVYIAFDVLYLDGHAWLDEPYRDRRDILTMLDLGEDRWHVSPMYEGDGHAVVEATREQNLEGVIAKRLDSRYRPGKRSPEWRKITHTRTLEVVVGGWQEGTGTRARSFGSLLLGIPADRGLRYVGNVGTGFTEHDLRAIRSELDKRTRKTSPFDDATPRDRRSRVHWVSPDLVGEVTFREWTRGGRLRAPSWRGWRADKRPSDVNPE